MWISAFSSLDSEDQLPCLGDFLVGSLPVLQCIDSGIIPVWGWYRYSLYSGAGLWRWGSAWEPPELGRSVNTAGVWALHPGPILTWPGSSADLGPLGLYTYPHWAHNSMIETLYEIYSMMFCWPVSNTLFLCVKQVTFHQEAIIVNCSYWHGIHK